MSGSLQQLSEKYYLDEGTKKPGHYFDFYESIFSSIQNQHLEILELGVYSGASVLIWRDYFPNATIVGLDIMPPPDRLAQQIAAGEIHFVQGDQSSPDSLRQAIARTRSGQFDIIIDDASHVGWLSKAAFDFLFVHGLRNGGSYFVEDFGTGYMRDFPDGAAYQRPSSAPGDAIFHSHQHGMVGWLKELVDELHGPWIMPPSSDMLPLASIQFRPHIALLKKQ